MMNHNQRKKWIFTLNEPDGKLNLFQLSLPLMLQQLLNYSINSVHTIALTSVSPEAVAASSVSSSIMALLNGILNCASFGLNIMLSHALGRNDRKEGDQLFSSCIVLSLLLSLALGLGVAGFAPLILQSYDLEKATFDYAVLYLRISASTAFLSALISCLVTAFRCFGKTSISVFSGLLANVVNMILCLLVVNDLIPAENKVVTIAFCGRASTLLQLILLTIFFTSMKKLRLRPVVNLAHIWKMFVLGFTSTLGTYSWQIASTVTVGLVSSLGTSALNTRVYVNNIARYVPIVSSTISTATVVMLGRLLGRKEYDTGKRLVTQNVAMAIISNGLLSAAVFIFSRPLLGLFTTDETIIAACQTLLLLDIAVEIFRSINHIYGNAALISAHDVRFTSFTGIISCWLISVGGAWFFGIQLGMGLPGFYLAFILDEGLRSLLYFTRWKSGKWMSHLVGETAKTND